MVSLPLIVLIVKYLISLGVSQKVDVLYAVDGSRRVDEGMFKEMHDFLRSSVRSFNLSASESHAGILQYGDRAEILLKPKDGTSLMKFEDTANKLSRIGGARRMNRALKIVNKEVYGTPGEIRSGAKRIIILLTTGKNSGDDSGELPRVARELRDEGVEIMVVVIGKESDPKEIDTITGKKGGSIFVKDPRKLKEVVGQLEQMVNDLGGMKTFVDHHLHFQANPTWFLTI